MGVVLFLLITINFDWRRIDGTNLTIIEYYSSSYTKKSMVKLYKFVKIRLGRGVSFYKWDFKLTLLSNWLLPADGRNVIEITSYTWAAVPLQHELLGQLARQSSDCQSINWSSSITDWPPVTSATTHALSSVTALHVTSCMSVTDHRCITARPTDTVSPWINQYQHREVAPWPSTDL